jgi:NAD(P)-dependent dehydrogenase (short-subunit alcohol dehydrogenase family)
VLTVKPDVLDQSSAESAAKKVEQEFGGLDILAYLEIAAPIAGSDPKEWWYTMEVNIKGIYSSTRTFLPVLLKGGSKAIVKLTSIGAYGMRPAFSSYQTTKVAVIRFAEFIMSEYGDQGVLEYAVHPGGIIIEIGVRMPKQARGLLTDTLEHAGDTILWLTQEKRDWLPGRYISCIWDMSELTSRKDEIVESDKWKVRILL